MTTEGALRIVAEVRNQGPIPAPPTSLALRRMGADGVLLTNLPVSALEPRGSIRLAWSLPDGTQREGESRYQMVLDEGGTTGDIEPGNNQATFVAALVRDADRDGMPDSWEVAHGLNPSEPSDAGIDADGDGVGNLAEYLAGTLPRDAGSYLLMRTDRERSGPSPQGIRLSWASAANTLYTVERTTDVGRSFVPVAEHILSTPPETGYLDASATNDVAYFYRMRVE